MNIIWRIVKFYKKESLIKPCHDNSRKQFIFYSIQAKLLNTVT